MDIREPIPVYGKKKISIQEYLAWEEAATEKHEYYNGEVFAMSGAKVAHNVIAGNIFGSLSL
ncbi:MAG: hypothetical protein C4308_12410 [Chitinophagaceae bacterium]